jgi:hypothetical protein
VPLNCHYAPIRENRQRTGAPIRNNSVSIIPLLLLSDQPPHHTAFPVHRSAPDPELMAALESAHRSSFARPFSPPARIPPQPVRYLNHCHQKLFPVTDLPQSPPICSPRGTLSGVPLAGPARRPACGDSLTSPSHSEWLCHWPGHWRSHWPWMAAACREPSELVAGRPGWLPSWPIVEYLATCPEAGQFPL